MTTNKKSIREAIRNEIASEDCMIPMSQRF